MDNLLVNIAPKPNHSQSNNAAKTAVESEEKPLMLLFQRLIGVNDNKQNTVLTNAQIINILDKEFNIKVSDLHELEVEIYLNVMKKFLKDWPRWDEFDKILTRLRNAKDQEMIAKTLEHKYTNLKQYLQRMLSVTQPMAQEAIKKINKETAKQNTKEPSENLDVVLEINCTREQLNNLIFKQPQPSLNYTIFNIECKRNVIIASGKIPLKSMLQWSNIKISINLKKFCYIRTFSSNLKHVLVNKTHSVSSSLYSALNDDLQIKIMNAKKRVKWEKQAIKDFFQNIILKSCNNSDFYDLLVNIFEILKMDLEDCPQSIYVPGSYKKYASKYPYVRYLNAESNTVQECVDKFNLQLEEIIHPMHKFTINKLMKMTYNEKIDQTDWLHIECTDCSMKFSGKELLKNFTEHFNIQHFKDLGCMCTNCNVFFTMLQLVENRWRHTCGTS